MIFLLHATHRKIQRHNYTHHYTNLHFVYCTSCCPHADKILPKLPAPHRMFSRFILASTELVVIRINGRQTNTHHIWTEGSTSVGFRGMCFLITGRREQDNRLAGVSSISPSTRQCTALLSCTMKTPVGAHLVDR